MELKLGGNVKDIVAMMYVGVVYEKNSWYHLERNS